MDKKAFKIGDVPALELGAPSDKVYVFLHGQSGCKEEGEAFAEIVCPKGFQVLAIDLPYQRDRDSDGQGLDPWRVVPELKKIWDYAFSRWQSVAARANSIGCWFTMLSADTARLKNALFVSPVLDMEKLICSMLGWAGVSEKRLEKEKIIPTNFGQTLDWDFLCYVREHPVSGWSVPTEILYAGGDNMTSRETAFDFAARFGCGITVMENGEHWFHTPEQLEVLQDWTEAKAVR